jgi:hypothetical protein
VIVTPRNLSRWRSSPPTIVGDSPEGRSGSSAGYVAHDVMTISTPAAIAAPNGSSSMPRRSASGTSSVTGPRSVFWATVAAPRPGKCFAVAAMLSACCAVSIATPHSAQTFGSSLYERPNSSSKLPGTRYTSRTGARLVFIPTPARFWPAPVPAAEAAAPGLADSPICLSDIVKGSTASGSLPARRLPWARPGALMPGDLWIGCAQAGG